MPLKTKAAYRLGGRNGRFGELRRAAEEGGGGDVKGKWGVDLDLPIWVCVFLKMFLNVSLEVTSKKYPKWADAGTRVVHTLVCSGLTKWRLFLM